MGINHNTICFIGKTFEDEEEAFCFLKNKGFFKNKSEEELDIMEEKIESGDTSLSEYLMSYSTIDSPSLSAEYLDAYTGQGYFIGYLLSIFDMQKDNKKYIKDREEAQENWLNLFKENGEEHLTNQIS